MASLLLWPLLCGCGGASAPHWTRPAPRGVAAVALWGGLGGYSPVACYDPLWVRLRGPEDCADLIPPGAPLRALAGGGGVVEGREPAPCGAVRLLSAGATPGWAVWPVALSAQREGAALRVDLDGDGAPERVTRPACPEGER